MRVDSWCGSNALANEFRKVSFVRLDKNANAGCVGWASLSQQHCHFNWVRLVSRWSGTSWHRDQQSKVNFVSDEDTEENICSVRVIFSFALGVPLAGAAHTITAVWTTISILMLDFHPNKRVLRFRIEQGSLLKFPGAARTRSFTFRKRGKLFKTP